VTNINKMAILIKQSSVHNHLKDLINRKARSGIILKI